MLNNLLTIVAGLAGLTLLTVAVPGPIMLDLLGAGLASIGLGMMYERV